MTVDNATMEDMEAEADHLGIQLSSIDLNSSNPPLFNFRIFRYPIPTQTLFLFFAVCLFQYLNFFRLQLLTIIPRIFNDFNFVIHSECQVFYDDNGFIPNIEFGSVIVVNNVPIVEAEMAEELESEIREVFRDVGVIKEDGFSMPVNPNTQETLGHCYIEFNSPQVLALFLFTVLVSLVSFG